MEQKKLTIGFSYWGFCSPFGAQTIAGTPDGFRYQRPLLVSQLLKDGNRVIALQMRRESEPIRGLEFDLNFPKIDMLLIEWRWPTYKNSGVNATEPDYARQMALIKHYYGRIPILAIDSDCALTAEDEHHFPAMIVAETSLNPKVVFKSRISLPPWTDFRQVMPIVEPLPIYTYVGNNYKRDDAISRFYFRPAPRLRRYGVKKPIQTTLVGNWLETSPERGDVKTLMNNAESVSFVPRLDWFPSMQLLNKSVTTTLVTRPEYAERGLISARVFESLAFGLPAIMPSDFYEPTLLGEHLIAEDSEDIIRLVGMISHFSLDEREKVVAYQREWLKKNYGDRVDVRYTADVISKIGNGIFTF